MGQPDIQQTFNSVSVEGFDQIYQPEPTEAQTAPELAQTDPIVEVKGGPDQQIQPDPSEGVSLEEASKVLGLHMDTVRKRLQKGKIRGFKVADKFGEKWLVHQDELAKARTYPTNPIQSAPAPVQGPPMDQAQAETQTIQADPVLEIQAGPEQSQPSSNHSAELERLMQIIESQAHQLKAAGDVIMYLRSEVDEAKTQVLLLTDRQHKSGLWARVRSWFGGKTTD